MLIKMQKLYTCRGFIKPFLLSHGNSPFLRDKRFRPRHVECVPVYVYKLVQTTFRYNQVTHLDSHVKHSFCFHAQEARSRILAVFGTFCLFLSGNFFQFLIAFVLFCHRINHTDYTDCSVLYTPTPTSRIRERLCSPAYGSFRRCMSW